MFGRKTAADKRIERMELEVRELKDTIRSVRAYLGVNTEGEPWNDMLPRDMFPLWQDFLKRYRHEKADRWVEVQGARSTAPLQPE